MSENDLDLVRRGLLTESQVGWVITVFTRD
jgi:hypothetical protein